MDELTELQKIYKKQLNEMNNVELAIWFTAEGTIAYDMDEAAEYLAALEGERDELRRLGVEVVLAGSITGAVIATQNLYEYLKTLKAVEERAALKAGAE
jgi:hypothetical protein